MWRDGENQRQKEGAERAMQARGGVEGVSVTEATVLNVFFFVSFTIERRHFGFKIINNNSKVKML